MHAIAGTRLCQDREGVFFITDASLDLLRPRWGQVTFKSKEFPHRTIAGPCSGHGKGSFSLWKPSNNLSCTLSLWRREYLAARLSSNSIDTIIFKRQLSIPDCSLQEVHPDPAVESDDSQRLERARVEWCFLCKTATSLDSLLYPLRLCRHPHMYMYRGVWLEKEPWNYSGSFSSQTPHLRCLARIGTHC